MRPPRVIWLMVPSGAPVDELLFGADGDGGLAALLAPGDTVIDGGNTFFRDDVVRAERLAELGIHFLDSGTSGGPAGAREGASLMIGGDPEVFSALEGMFADVAVPGGYKFFPGHGAGHFVKMVHNGIEYGMMQAIAEGFQVMHEGPYDLDLQDVTDVYQHGSVVESRLVGWLGEAYAELGSDLEGVSGVVGHTGEGEWTIRVAEELGRGGTGDRRLAALPRGLRDDAELRGQGSDGAPERVRRPRGLGGPGGGSEAAQRPRGRCRHLCPVGSATPSPWSPRRGRGGRCGARAGSRRAARPR